MNPLLLPPRLALRALDDLHTLARTASEAVVVLRRLEARAERLEATLDDALEVGRAVERRAGELSALGDRTEERLDALLAAAELHSTAIQASAREVATGATELASAVPTLRRAVELAEPLEGAVERIARVVEFLPGGGRRPAS